MASSQRIEQLQAFNHKGTQPHCLGDYVPPGKLGQREIKGMDIAI